jgi:competence transcription factor ComK
MTSVKVKKNQHWINMVHSLNTIALNLKKTEVIKIDNNNIGIHITTLVVDLFFFKQGI